MKVIALDFFKSTKTLDTTKAVTFTVPILLHLYNLYHLNKFIDSLKKGLLMYQNFNFRSSRLKSDTSTRVLTSTLRYELWRKKEGKKIEKLLSNILQIPVYISLNKQEVSIHISKYSFNLVKDKIDTLINTYNILSQDNRYISPQLNNFILKYKNKQDLKTKLGLFYII